MARVKIERSGATMKVGAPDYRIDEALGLNPDAPAQRP
jgi:hypothetical protein